MFLRMIETSRWPKQPPPLSEAQRKAKADFLKLWHEVLPRKYGLIEKFNHECPILKKSVTPGCRTLEIGAGLGEHLAHENWKIQDYTAMEIRADFVKTIQTRFPGVKAITGDIQQRLDFPDGHFDRIVAIHILEHLPNLPAALREIRRLLKPGGKFVVVIPCEGGLAYWIARRISAQRIFEREFKMPYTPIVRNEHVSQAWEILIELKKHFRISQTDYWPLKIPLVPVNLVAALECL